MKRLMLFALLLAFLPVQVVAMDYLQMSVGSGLPGTDGNEIMSVLTCMDSHSVDGVWTAPSEYRKMSLVAGDYLSDWYFTVGPDSRGNYTAYIFSGLDVDPLGRISVLFSSSGNATWDILITDHNRTPVFHEVITGVGRVATGLTPVPAGLNQKRTQGYMVAVTKIPEPGGLATIFTGLIGFGGFIARRRK